jgi:hypothetical protein
MELRVQIVGAQATAILPADLYNSVRYAVYKTGRNFSDLSYAYLSGVVNHGILDDVTAIYVDETVSLPTQAFDATSGYNVPQVVNKFHRIPLNLMLDFYSLTAAGTGSWDTVKEDILIDRVSDSSITPHPSVSYNARIFFRFM